MFKVGDTVLVRYHSHEEKYHYPGTWFDVQDVLQGRLVTITEIIPMITRLLYKVEDAGHDEAYFLEYSLIASGYEQF